MTREKVDAVQHAAMRLRTVCHQRERGSRQARRMWHTAFGHQFRAIEQHLGQKRKQLEQRDAGIILVEVRPFSPKMLREPLQPSDEVAADQVGG